MNDKRERLYEQLMRCSPENTRSGAIDQAVLFYCIMVGGNGYVPGDGQLADVMNTAIEEGSVTPEQIADCLDSDPVPVKYEVQRELSVGQSD